MPPRKSNVSVISLPVSEETSSLTPPKAALIKDGLSVEDLSLPKSMIARLAKGVLPANTQIHKDALLALHKSATVFVSYIASTSNELAQSAGKKTIAPHDVMAALKDCEFEEFLPRLEAELKKYNEVQCDKRNTYRRKVKEEKAATATATDGPEGSEGLHEGEVSAFTDAGNDTSIITNGHGEVEDEDRPAKKFKAADGTAAALDASGLEDDDMEVDQDGEEDVDEHHEDDDVVEEDEEDAELDEDPGAQLVDDPDPDEGPSFSHERDEALDDGGSESDEM